MSELKPTGNPVFDYRADFRASASGVQRAMLSCGGALFVLSTAACFFCPAGGGLRAATAAGAGLGLLLLIGGVCWAFHWRRKLRDEFREKFGGK